MGGDKGDGRVQERRRKRHLKGLCGVSKSSASKAEWFHLLHDGGGVRGGLQPNRNTFYVKRNFRWTKP